MKTTKIRKGIYKVLTKECAYLVKQCVDSQHWYVVKEHKDSKRYAIIQFCFTKKQALKSLDFMIRSMEN